MGESCNTKPKWYTKKIIAGTYQLYTDLIEQVVAADYTLFITLCPQCQSLFTTKTCNQQRDDIYCPFGCRQMKKKAKARERSKKYYGSSKGRKNKKRHNRSRNDKTLEFNTDEAEDNKEEEIDPMISYAKLIIDSVTKKEHEISEIKEIFNKVRSRSLDSIDLSNVLDRYE